MTRDDYPAFSAAMTAAAELYGRTLSESAIVLWWESLQRFEIEDVQRALRGAIEDPDSGQFMPKPADLIRRLEGTAGDRSLLAWGKVLDAMCRVGAYQSVVFDDPAIHCAIDDMGGWPKVCRSSVDELPFVQRRFCETHRAYGRQPSVQYPPRLIGDSEAANAMSGRPSPAPVLIGDPERAAEVLRMGVGGRAKTAITMGDALVKAVQGVAA